jgi:hypothetical protein
MKRKNQKLVMMGVFGCLIGAFLFTSVIGTQYTDSIHFEYELAPGQYASTRLSFTDDQIITTFEVLAMIEPVKINENCSLSGYITFDSTEEIVGYMKDTNTGIHLYDDDVASSPSQLQMEKIPEMDRSKSAMNVVFLAYNIQTHVNNSVPIVFFGYISYSYTDNMDVKRMVIAMVFMGLMGIGAFLLYHEKKTTLPGTNENSNTNSNYSMNSPVNIPIIQPNQATTMGMGSTKFCSKCGSKEAADARYCQACGGEFK